jgi:hypothetical protein
VKHGTPGVADIFRSPAADALLGLYRGATRRVFTLIRNCRTPRMGARHYRCSSCSESHVTYNSCRNRHCPACQGNAAHQWLDRQVDRLLPAPYFHIVFTMPKSIARIAYANRKVVLGILMKASAETVITIAADPKRFGAKVGGTTVLHTWDQRLQFHPHTHVVVPNGGFDVATGRYKTGSAKYFAPAKVLASYFRRRFLEQLSEAYRRGQLAFPGSISHLEPPEAFQKLVDEARSTDWVVYAKEPLAGPEKLLGYLSRYTHRVAIGDSRILGFDGSAVRFRYREPCAKGKRKKRKPTYGEMELPVAEFIRRYLSHCLPRGFHRIRHFGILGNSSVRRTRQKISEQRGWTAEQARAPQTGAKAAEPVCPQCKTPMMLAAIWTASDIALGLHDDAIRRKAAPGAARAPPLSAAA